MLRSYEHNSETKKMKTYLLSKNSNQSITIQNIEVTIKNQELIIYGHKGMIFGMGERFDAIDISNKRIMNMVLEKFCHQGENTYLPLPFFMLEEGVGIFVHSNRIFEAKFDSNISINLNDLEDQCEIHIWEASSKELVQKFIKVTGESLLPPKWAFGPWLSGHRWNSEKLVQEQLTLSQSHDFPFTTLVIEQWSDEATFYIFNQAKYSPTPETLKYEDFTFDENAKWPNPRKMFETFRQQGIHTLLWQAPVIKQLEDHEPRNIQNEIDHEVAIKMGYIVKNEDFSPYQIPKGHWFPGSLIPDFSNLDTKEWWFSKHQYLLDIGVEGFKTDGGEFIYNPNSIFKNGKRGVDMINCYSADYIKAYHDFVGNDRVLFSRAGYLGQQANTIHWAGDQKSEWSELKAVYNAGISASMSGQTFWSFDIGGFAGELPSLELYIRATQFSVMTPIMQLHSEPVGGQFALLDASKVMKNDRTPWNITEHYGETKWLDDLKFYYHLRMNLLPSIYSWAIESVNTKMPLMQHMWLAFPNDKISHRYHEQYYFGRILFAPILYENIKTKEICFPKGTWRHLLTGHTYEGERVLNLSVTSEKSYFVYVKEGSALFLRLDADKKLGSRMTNKIETPAILNVWCYGEIGEDSFVDDEGNNFSITWKNKKHTIKGSCNIQIEIEFK